MKEQTWSFTDKSKWPLGEWMDEPDKGQWLDETTGMPCLIHRGPSGALCGYVGVSKGHPHFEKDYNDVYVDCHGGLTFADKCGPKKENGGGICHTVEPGEDDKVWWFGFDCAHAGDLCPAYSGHESMRSFNDSHESYRGWNYVKQQTAELAAQLKAFAP